MMFIVAKCTDCWYSTSYSISDSVVRWGETQHEPFVILFTILSLPPRLSRYYDDFHTIDWVRDRNRDRLRHKRLNRDGRLSWRGATTKMWDAGSGWLIVFLVGVSSGLLAGKPLSLSLSHFCLELPLSGVTEFFSTVSRNDRCGDGVDVRSEGGLVSVCGLLQQGVLLLDQQ